ncbi:MAG: hypothetical protein AAGI08_15285 [Bacteroidota bacterium]
MPTIIGFVQSLSAAVAIIGCNAADANDAELPREQQEPPLMYEVSIGGNTHRIASGDKRHISIDGQKHEVRFRVLKWRSLDVGDFSFDFPASHRVGRAALSGGAFVYHITGKKSYVTVLVSKPGRSRLMDIAVEECLGDFRREAIKTTLETGDVELNGNNYSTKTVTSADSIVKLNQPEHYLYIQIPTKNHTCLVTIQDDLSPRGGHSDEYSITVERLKTSFRLLPN